MRKCECAQGSEEASCERDGDSDQAQDRLLLATVCFLPPKSHFLTRSHHTHTAYTHTHSSRPSALSLPNLTFSHFTHSRLHSPTFDYSPPNAGE